VNVFGEKLWPIIMINVQDTATRERGQRLSLGWKPRPDLARIIRRSTGDKIFMPNGQQIIAYAPITSSLEPCHMASGMKMDGFTLEDQLAHLEAVASYDLVSSKDAFGDFVNMLEQLVHHL